MKQMKLLEGIDRLDKEGDSENLCEELGDVLFQVALHSVIAQEEGLFTIEDVVKGNPLKNAVPPPKNLFSRGFGRLLTGDELKKREKEGRGQTR